MHPAAKLVASAAAVLLALTVTACSARAEPKPQSEPTSSPAVAAPVPTVTKPVPVELTPEQQAFADESAAWEDRRAAVTSEQWAVGCPIIDRAWTMSYLGDTVGALYTLHEAEAAMGATDVLYSLRDEGGASFAVSMEIDNGQCLLLRPQKNLCMYAAPGTDNGPLERARGNVTETRDGRPYRYEVAPGDTWERIKDRFCGLAPSTDELYAGEEIILAYTH